LALLEVTDLKVHFRTDDGIVKAVDGVSYTIERGQALGIVGESGSGKSVSSLTVMGLTRFASNAMISGSIIFDGKDLLSASDEDMRTLRGNDVAMIFQDPLSSLHPFYKIGDQLVEAIQAHRDVSKAQALDRAVEMLGLVGIPEPRRRVDSYPHEFSGGMRQRVMIAMALINDPKLLIADEPTTALDVTVQAQILDLIQRLQRELDTAIVMITHDLGVVAEVADDIGVMYAGRIVEYADKDTIFAAPEHPYTWGLLKSIPRLDSPRGEELVPIPGRPPSLIIKPPGCAFHPRCPYVREAHTKIDPQLAPAADAGNGGGHRHEVACLLPGQTRRALWAALRTGEVPEQALTHVDVPETAVDREAVGEVLAPAGTEVAEGVVAEGVVAEAVPMDPTPPAATDEEGS
jgi:peptide/nickel transport system ATP-binding protein